MAGVASKQDRQRQAIPKPPILGLPNGGLETIERSDPGVVEKRSVNRGDRDAVESSDLVRWKESAVSTDPITGAGASR